MRCRVYSSDADGTWPHSIGTLVRDTSGAHAVMLLEATFTCLAAVAARTELCSVKGDQALARLKGCLTELGAAHEEQLDSQGLRTLVAHLLPSASELESQWLQVCQCCTARSTASRPVHCKRAFLQPHGCHLLQVGRRVR